MDPKILSLLPYDCMNYILTFIIVDIRGSKSKFLRFPNIYTSNLVDKVTQEVNKDENLYFDCFSCDQICLYVFDSPPYHKKCLSNMRYNCHHFGDDEKLMKCCKCGYFVDSIAMNNLDISCDECELPVGNICILCHSESMKYLCIYCI